MKKLFFLLSAIALNLSVDAQNWLYPTTTVTTTTSSVGIGTTGPDSKLHLKGGNFHLETGINNLNPLIAFGKNTINQYGQYTIEYIPGSGMNFGTPLGSAKGVQNNILFLSQVGKVGIGKIINPTDAYGARLQIAQLATTAQNDKILDLIDGSRRMFFITNLSGWGYCNKSRNNDFGFFWSDGQTFPTGITPQNSKAGLIISPFVDCRGGIRIDALGNVGIGTDLIVNTYNGVANYYMLSVGGSIRAKEIVVETGWADYVFDKKYKLLTLDSLENYIQVNKHLPNIPAAAEVEKNGISLGEMQVKQMEKIEEVSIYLIEMNRQLKELREENKLLRNEVDELKNK